MPRIKIDPDMGDRIRYEMLSPEEKLKARDRVDRKRRDTIIVNLVVLALIFVVGLLGIWLHGKVLIR